MVAARDARAWAAEGGLHGIGDSPYSRPPQARLPEEVRAQIHDAHEASGMAAKARVPATASVR